MEKYFEDSAEGAERERKGGRKNEIKRERERGTKRKTEREGERR